MFNWILDQLVDAILTQLKKIGAEADWAEIKENVDKAVREAIPGEQYDDIIASVVGFLVDAIAKYFQDGDLVVGKHVSSAELRGAVEHSKKELVAHLASYTAAKAAPKKAPKVEKTEEKVEEAEEEKPKKKKKK